MMRKLFLTMLLVFVAATMVQAQKTNDTPDAIVGKYQLVQGGMAGKVVVQKLSSGTYRAQIYWVEDSIDPKTHQLRLDVKNPDKKLRTTPCNKIVVMRDMRYDADKKEWNGGKVYDPLRGIRANCTAHFKDGKLMVKGSVLGISETSVWTPVK